MGVHIKPCYRCPVSAGCTLRPVWRKKLRSLGLRTAAFDCPRLAAEIRPGRRVVITAPVSGSSFDDDGYCPVHLRKVRATITATRPDRSFAATVDPGQMSAEDWASEPKNGKTADIFRFRRRMQAFRVVAFLDEPDARLCGSGHVQRNGECDVPEHEDKCWADRNANALDAA